MFLIIEAMAGFFSGILGSMGLGGGGILIIYLTLMSSTPQALAQGINLIFFIPMAATATIMHSREKLVQWKIAIPSAISGLMGAAIGSFLTSFIDNLILRKMFGALLIIMGAMQFYKVRVSFMSARREAEF